MQVGGLLTVNTQGGGCTLLAARDCPVWVKLVVRRLACAGLVRYGNMETASRAWDLGTAWRTSMPAISPNSAYRSATLTIAVTWRPGLVTRGPATISGTHTPV